MKPSAEEMLKKYSKDIAHANEVKRLALIIFDEASLKIHEMTELEKEYLEAASLLHDIGYFIEAKIIACVARYHRGGLPDKESHEIYGSLEKKDRKTVKRLGGILKLADGLCKDHSNQFKNIEINYDNKNSIAKFILYPQNNKPDIKTAIRKRDLFEIGFKCQSVLLFGE